MTPSIEDLNRALAGRYLVEREVGQGGMATVYLAQDVRHERKVAIKVLRPELAASLGAERFHREIRIAAALQHPHILPLYDSGDAAGVLYYVMPFVDGTSLRQKLLKEVELPVSDAVRILRDVADALAAAHAHGVVHRDLKPENVMLSGRHALVADFGVAKAVSESTGRQALTTLGVALGTPTYMAPEQATADPHLDHRADIYAFGVMAYELLAGRPPFTGMSPQEVLAAQVTTAAEPVTKHRAAIPPVLSALVMRCLEKRPADRWQTAEELIPQLESVLTPSGGLTPAETRPYPAAAGTSQKKRTALIAGIATIVLLGVAGALYWRAHRAAGSANERAIAVLPFDDLAGDTANQAFVLGMHGEIVTQLSKLPGLQVASRSSSASYRGSRKSHREIAAELGVDKLLTGSVQRAGGQIRLQVSLEDAAHGRDVWGDSYSKQLTAENLFAIQGEVASQVANALSIRLNEAQRTEIAKAPTTNLEALDAYHRADEAWTDRGANSTTDSMAVQQAERAVALDSNFVQAWGLLAETRSWQVRNATAFDTLPAWRAAQRAQQLAPGSLDARLASGYYRYYARGDYAGALADLQDADRLLPNSSELALVIGYLQRRVGKWDDALASFNRATVLDRRFAPGWAAIGESQEFLGHMSEAMRALDQALALSPSSAKTAALRFTTILYGLGDTTQAFAYAAAAKTYLSARDYAVAAYFPALIRRDAKAQIETARTGQPSGSSGSLSPHVAIAIAYRFAGNRAAARAYADSARAVDDTIIARIRGLGNLFGQRSLAELQTAIALAAAGDSVHAVPMGERAAAAYTRKDDAIEGVYSSYYLALVYALSGRKKDAIAQLREAMRPPLAITPFNLRLDPFWDALRGDPEFEALARGPARTR